MVFLKCAYNLQDELLWAATWLYMATKRAKYLHYIEEESISENVKEFSWDLKYAGAQILLSKVFPLIFSHTFSSFIYLYRIQFYFEGKKSMEKFKNQADSFICSVLPDSPSHQIYITPGFPLSSISSVSLECSGKYSSISNACRR